MVLRSGYGSGLLCLEYGSVVLLFEGGTGLVSLCIALCRPGDRSSDSVVGIQRGPYHASNMRRPGSRRNFAVDGCPGAPQIVRSGSDGPLRSGNYSWFFCQILAHAG